MVQLGDDLGNTQGIGIEGDDDIEFVQSGQRHKGIGLAHSFTFQKILLADIAADDVGIRKQFAQLSAAV